MPTTARNIERRSQRSERVTQPPPGRTRRASRCAFRASAPNVLTLAPASVLSLPTLAGIPQSFTYSTETSVLLPVAEYLTEQGHGTRREWEAAAHDLTKFVALSINRLIHSTGLKPNAKHNAPTLNAELIDHDGYYSKGDAIDGHKLRLAIGGSECGWFRMGPITRKLERTAKGLGAAFYAAVIDSLGAVGWVFDYSNAMQDREYMIEGLELENGKEYDTLTAEERSQYEIPDPDAAIPAHLQPVKCGGFTAKHRDLMKKHRKIAAVDLALQMGELAAQLHGYATREYIEGDAPCTYIIFIKDHDPITAAFDEWSQHFLEGDVTHIWVRTFNPADPKEIARAFEAFTLASRLFATAAKLTPIVNGAK